MYPKGPFRQPHSNRLRIGTRLTICFVIIVALMVAGYSIALWQFNLIRQESQRLDRVDQKSLAVLRVHANILLFRDKLEDLVATKDAERLTLEAAAFRDLFREVVEHAQIALKNSSPNSGPDPTILSTLQVVEGTLSNQITAMTNLAAAGDAVFRRIRRPRLQSGGSRYGR